jgi:hypothetical protein
MLRPTSRDAVVCVTTPQPAPAWALLERHLLAAQAEACAAFFARYFDDRGSLLCVPRWSGDDGPDDAIENVLSWTMLHALGADDRVLALYERAWEGHLHQYSEAKTMRQHAVGAGGVALSALSENRSRRRARWALGQDSPE